MAAASEEVTEAIRKVEAVSLTLHQHIGAQAQVNQTLTKDIEKNSADIINVRLEMKDKDTAIALMGADVKRMLLILENGQNKFLSWFKAATPWLFVIGGLVYFYMKN